MLTYRRTTIKTPFKHFPVEPGCPHPRDCEAYACNSLCTASKKDFIVPLPPTPRVAVVAAGGIGNIDSDEKGSGARYNDGKADLSLIPLGLLAQSTLRLQPESTPAKALVFLGHFQRTHDTFWLWEAMQCLGVVEGWVECARVFDYGRGKYKAWNWAKGMPWTAPLASAARHLLAMIHGEVIDPESGLPHRGHFFCNAVMLLTYVEHYAEGNDLPAKGVLG